MPVTITIWCCYFLAWLHSVSGKDRLNEESVALKRACTIDDEFVEATPTDLSLLQVGAGATQGALNSMRQFGNGTGTKPDHALAQNTSDVLVVEPNGGLGTVFSASDSAEGWAASSANEARRASFAASKKVPSRNSVLPVVLAQANEKSAETIASNTILVPGVVIAVLIVSLAVLCICCMFASDGSNLQNDPRSCPSIPPGSTGSDGMMTKFPPMPATTGPAGGLVSRQPPSSASPGKLGTPQTGSRPTLGPTPVVDGATLSREQSYPMPPTGVNQTRQTPVVPAVLPRMQTSAVAQPPSSILASAHSELPSIYPQLVMPLAHSRLAIPVEPLRLPQFEVDVLGLSGVPLLSASLTRKDGELIIQISLHSVGTLLATITQKLEMYDSSSRHFGTMTKEAGNHYILRGLQGQTMLNILDQNGDLSSFKMSAVYEGRPTDLATCSRRPALQGRLPAEHFEVVANPNVDAVLALVCFLAVIVFQK